jgi:hypothetical protein
VQSGDEDVKVAEAGARKKYDCEKLVERFADVPRKPRVFSMSKML